MQTYEPDLTKKDHEIRETIIQRFLHSFEDNSEHKPRDARNTCDLHLAGQQPVLYVTPKKQGTENILWQEPKDMLVFWSSKLKTFWFFIMLISAFFFIFLWYNWSAI